MTRSKRSRVISAVVGAAVLVGCGRSVHTNAQSEGQGVKQYRARATDFVEVTWQGKYSNVHSTGNGWVAEDGVHYVSDSPVSIPAEVPDTLNFKMDVPKRFGNLSLALHADLISKDGISTGVSVRNLFRESNTFHFQFSGVSGVFANVGLGGAGEKRTLLQVIGTNPVTGETVFEGKMNLVTPPTHVSILQESVGLFEKHAGALTSSHKSIRLAGQSLRLLQVLTFHNPSDFSVDVVVPFKLSGGLMAHFEDVTVEARLCSYSTHSFTRSKALSKELWVVPFGIGLSTENAEDEGDHTVRIPLDPEANGFAGIYATGKEVDEVADGSYPTPVFDETDVVDACNAHCMVEGRTTMWNCGRVFSLKKEGESSPNQFMDSAPGGLEACQAMKNPFNFSGYSSPPDDQKLVDQCAEWDITNTPTPWDTHRCCQSTPPGHSYTTPHERWDLHPHHTTVKSGTQALPLTVEVDPGHLNGLLSFGGLDNEGESQSTDTLVFSAVSAESD